jgi:hypothetical protein
MLAKVLRSKGFWALVLPVFLAGSVFAGGADCNHKSAEVAKAGKGAAHCNLLSKQVAKNVKQTDDGVIVSLEGKTETAISHIKEHLSAHAEGATDCPNCPLSMDGVTAKVKMTKTGGKITAKGNSPEAVEALKEWANKPVGTCCAGEKDSEA